jgi:hypothetical protein
MNRVFIAPTVSAVAASADTEFTVQEGASCSFSLDAGIGVEEVEIKQRVGATYTSITDPSDPVDTTKKVLSSAFNVRQVYGPIIVAVDKPATASATGVYINIRMV